MGPFGGAIARACSSVARYRSLCPLLDGFTTFPKPFEEIGVRAHLRQSFRDLLHQFLVGGEVFATEAVFEGRVDVNIEWR